jgi:hypothetical protein
MQRSEKAMITNEGRDGDEKKQEKENLCATN